jgi:hypothetical protein
MTTQNIVDRPKQSPRIEQERAKRRRRDDMGTGRLRNLAISGTMDLNYAYRWINDEPGRVYRLTQDDDWERVTLDMLGHEGDSKDKALGAGVERIVDRATGKRAILVRKLKEYVETDKAKEQASIDELEGAIKRGETRSPEGLSGPHAYVPSGGIVIQDGRRG